MQPFAEGANILQNSLILSCKKRTSEIGSMSISVDSSASAWIPSLYLSFISVADKEHLKSTYTCIKYL